MDRDIGLALSGGGFRAVAFHLGCLRALHDRDLLRRVSVVSGVSGGALIAAMWAYGPKDFGMFEDTVTQLLRTGLQGALIRKALRPMAVMRSSASATRLIVSPNRVGPVHNRTEVFARVVADRLFGDRLMSDVTHTGLGVVLNATDLCAGGAIRFGSRLTSSSRLGDVVDAVRVAEAVAASAAYPLFLPALRRTYTFQRSDKLRRGTLLLSDGGIYDNLGLSVLQPGRSAAHTSHVYDVKYIVSCDAGRANAVRLPRFLAGRAARAFDIVHRRAQDHGRARLFEWTSAGMLDGFVMSYLSMQDRNLPSPVADLVAHESVATHPTNFAAMSLQDLHLLSARGEQLTRTLIPFYCPALR